MFLNSISNFYVLGGFILVGLLVMFCFSKSTKFPAYKKLHKRTFLPLSLISIVLLISYYLKNLLKETDPSEPGLEGIIEYAFLFVNSMIYTGVLFVILADMCITRFIKMGYSENDKE